MPAPLIITGLPCTGTTMLHNVLTLLPGFRAFSVWEMRSPVTPEGAGPEWKARQIARTNEDIRALYQRVPGFDRIHKVEAQAPDECNRLFRHGFTTQVFAYLYRITSYMRWVTSAPRHTAYTDYRRHSRCCAIAAPKGS